MISSWSISTLHDFKDCAYKIKLAKIDKVKRTQNEYAEKGLTVHKELENAIKHNTKHNQDHFDYSISRLRQAFLDGQVRCEDEWAFDMSWKPCDFKAANAYVRMVIDVFERINETDAAIIDFKTGKDYPIKHLDQVRLYATGAFHKYPKLKTIFTDLWYLDQQTITNHVFIRDDLNKMQQSYDFRALKLLSETEFKPNPNKYKCSFCNVFNHCEYRDDSLINQENKND